MTKVSVIIPVYNVEAYIGECLDSLVNQTLREIEIICVDDGSTDSTLSILERYRQADPRVQVYHQQNKFAGVARNNGMQHATGKYLLFLDSDDFFEKTMLEKAYLEAERCSAEVVLFGAKLYDHQTKVISEAPSLFRRQALPAQVPFSAAETEGTLLWATPPAPWTKLYLADYIRTLGIEYMALRNSNDVYFTYVALCCAKRISCVDEPFVFYRVNTGTSLQNTKSKHPLCFMDAYVTTFRTLNRMGVYDSVARGFRSAVVDGCVYNFESVGGAAKTRIGRSFLTEEFEQMELLSGQVEEYGNPDNYHRLEQVIAAFRWKQQPDPPPPEDLLFAPVYTRFLRYLTMADSARSPDLSVEEQSGLAQQMDEALAQLRSLYASLPAEQQSFISLLDPAEQSLFAALAVLPAPEYPDVRGSLSYRIGRIVTFLPRALRAVASRLRTNGLKHTLRYCIGRLKGQN